MPLMPPCEIVFIYGALRSGTTLFRLMLDAHPQIANPGEMDFLFDHLHPDDSHPTGWSYDLEKLRMDRIFQAKGLIIPDSIHGVDLLHNFFDQLRAQGQGASVVTINIHRHIDKLLKIAPNTKLIHVLRDPRDVARSSIHMGWGYNLFFAGKHWIETEQSWQDNTGDLPSDQVLTLRYEDLLSDLDTHLNRVCQFLGHPMDPQMLRYHETSTYAPPDPNLIAQWRSKCTADDIALLEGRIGPLLQQSGYQPNGAGRFPGALERRIMRLRQKRYHWMFNSRRFGFWRFLSARLTRVLKLKRWHMHLQTQINQIHQAQLK
ncbi:sulfotransferase [Aestuariibius sp. HNIBRBA575]|uniref:sulfotransferase family protein n=1 Tax=Aestuariibius sp. HNIBRBA575 TaxID=3233343 RepID=UPI0034A4A63A